MMSFKINEKFNEGMIAFAGQDYGTCIDTLTEVVQRDQNHKLAYVSRGAAFMKTGETKTAMNDFNRAIELDPKYARAHHLRGLAREMEGDDQGAIGDFTKAIELSPEYGAAYHSRATLYTKLGEMDLATEDIQMVTHLTQRNIESYANENNVWRSNQMHVEAMMETELNR
jgi:Tfp pilus assembly protein PilF